MDGHSRYAHDMAALATALHTQRDEIPTARTIVDQALVVIPEARHASITVRARKGSFETRGASSAVAEEADAAQYDLAEGPCVETAVEGGWYRSDDLGEDDRWPSWGPRARDLGLHSLLSVRLIARDEPYGAINLYSDRHGAFSDVDALDRALLWSTHAAHALASARVVSGLESALASRHLIGMAQGMVMQRFELSEDQSFQLLCRLSSHRNEKLREIAATIVRTGDLPA